MRISSSRHSWTPQQKSYGWNSVNSLGHTKSGTGRSKAIRPGSMATGTRSAMRHTSLSSTGEPPQLLVWEMVIWQCGSMAVGKSRKAQWAIAAYELTEPEWVHSLGLMLVQMV